MKKFPGWQSLIDPLIRRCEEEGAKIVQIKEKFGGLRFYADGVSEKLQDDIDMAEMRSFDMCMECGAIGKLRSLRGWMYVACGRHVRGEKK